MRSTWLCVGLLLSVLANSATAQASAADPDVKKGMQQTEDGDYDGAILTLDNAARRLSSNPAKSSDLSQAYLYLGIAYVGKGHEAAAKAKFREALKQFHDLQLTPDKFPPKIINLFEAAKQESVQSAAPTTAQAAPKKKGSKKVLLIGGAVVVAGGGAALALRGGSSDSSAPPGAERFGPITLAGDQYDRNFSVFVASAGTLTATLTWQEPGVALRVDLYDDTFSSSLASSNQTGNQEARLSASVQPQRYHLNVYRDCDCEGVAINFSLTVIHP